MTSILWTCLVRSTYLVDGLLRLFIYRSSNPSVGFKISWWFGHYLKIKKEKTIRDRTLGISSWSCGSLEVPFGKKTEFHTFRLRIVSTFSHSLREGKKVRKTKECGTRGSLRCRHYRLRRLSPGRPPPPRTP